MTRQGEGENDGDRTLWLPPVLDGKPQVLTAARQKRGDVVRVAGERGGVERRSIAEPLEWYVARRHITGDQYKAGTRLYALWKGSILGDRYATMRFGDVTGDFDPESMALMPRDYCRAMDAVHGFHRQRAVRLVCLWGEFAGTPAMMTYLREGLTEITEHFRK